MPGEAKKCSTRAAARCARPPMPMRKTPVVVFPAARQVSVETIDIPEPGRGHVLLESQCSLISTGTECTCLSGDFEEGTVWHRWVKYPFRPGYAVAARVVQIGDPASMAS